MGRLLFWGSAVAYAGTIVAGILLLPDPTPSHFDFAGQPDSWASRSSFLIALSLLGLGMTVLFASIGWLIDRLPLSVLNLPNKQWWTATPERTARVKQMVVADIRVIGTATMVLLSVSMLLVIRAARLPEPRLDWWFTLVFSGWLVGILAWTGWMIAFRYRPDPRDS